MAMCVVMLKAILKIIIINTTYGHLISIWPLTNNKYTFFLSCPNVQIGDLEESSNTKIEII